VVSVPCADWIGEETITFTVTDQTDQAFSASVEVLFKRQHFSMIVLHSGWNIISLPLNLTVASRAQFLATFAGPVWYWDGNRYRPINVDTDVSKWGPGRGLWGLFLGDTNQEPMELLGDVPSKFDVKLMDGWNLVGPSGVGQETVVPTVDVGDNAFMRGTIWSWKENLYEPVEDGLLQRNRAYWIRPEAGSSPTVKLELQ